MDKITWLYRTKAVHVEKSKEILRTSEHASRDDVTS
jgi:hypothetical protein